MAASSAAEAAIKKLARLPENSTCPNCGTYKKFGFSTVCMKSLTFVCNNCKSSHQAYSHRCKSLTMSAWTEGEVLQLKKAGNERAKLTWLGNAPPIGTGGRPKEGDHIDVFKTFIVKAYDQKLYYNESVESATTALSNKEHPDARPNDIYHDPMRYQAPSQTKARGPTTTSQSSLRMNNATARTTTYSQGGINGGATSTARRSTPQISNNVTSTPTKQSGVADLLDFGVFENTTSAPSVSNASANDILNNAHQQQKQNQQQDLFGETSLWNNTSTIPAFSTSTNDNTNGNFQDPFTSPPPLPLSAAAEPIIFDPFSSSVIAAGSATAPTGSNNKDGVLVTSILPSQQPQHSVKQKPIMNSMPITTPMLNAFENSANNKSINDAFGNMSVFGNVSSTASVMNINKTNNNSNAAAATTTNTSMNGIGNGLVNNFGFGANFNASGNMNGAMSNGYGGGNNLSDYNITGGNNSTTNHNNNFNTNFGNSAVTNTNVMNSMNFGTNGAIGTAFMGQSFTNNNTNFMGSNINTQPNNPSFQSTNLPQQQQQQQYPMSRNYMQSTQNNISKNFGQESVINKPSKPDPFASLF